MNTTDTSKNAAETPGAKLFFVTSLVLLVLTFLMLVGRPAFLATHVLTGHGLTWLLLLLLGPGLTGVFGLVYWAIPKAFGTPLYSKKIVVLHYGFHLFGTLLALVSVVWTAFARAEMGMTFIACGALALGINLAGTFRTPSKPDVASAYLAASVLWLIIAAFVGLPFIAEPPLALLVGTHWGAGWLVLAIAGVAINAPMGLALRVTPAALGISQAKSGPAWYALFLSNGSLAWMFPAMTFATPGFLLLCALIYGVGTLIYLATYFSILQQRAQPALAWDAKILLTAFSLVPVAAAFLVLSAWERFAVPVVQEAPGGLAGAEAVTRPGSLPLEFLPVDGAVVLTSLLAVAVPAIVALGFQLLRLDCVRPALDTTIPLRTRLSDQVLFAAFFNYAAGVLLVIPAAWVGIEQMLSLGSLFLLVGSLGFLGNIFFASSRKILNEPGSSQHDSPSHALAAP